MVTAMTKRVPTNDAKTRRTFTRSAFMARFLVARWLGKKRRGRQHHSEDTPARSVRQPSRRADNSQAIVAARTIRCTTASVYTQPFA